MTTYTVNIGAENAAWLTSRNGPAAGNAWDIRDSGDGTVTFHDGFRSHLASLADYEDGFIDASSVMWIEGTGFPVAEAVPSGAECAVCGCTDTAQLRPAVKDEFQVRRDGWRDFIPSDGLHSCVDIAGCMRRLGTRRTA